MTAIDPMDPTDFAALDRLAQRCAKRKVNVAYQNKPGDVGYLTPVVIAYVDVKDESKGTMTVLSDINLQVVATKASPGVYDIWIEGKLEATDLPIDAAERLLADEYRDFKYRYWTQRRAQAN